MFFVKIIYFYTRGGDFVQNDLKTQVLVALVLRGKTQTWLAEELDMNQGYLSRILNGKDKPEKQINRIKEKLGIKIEQEA
ncbi:hypothetical protein CBF37_11160 [Vagococcus vulneris]|uniref:HTH cro/C1-type domain-containing protein n=1 Tax=Vagococcus vulneris TaxID=1977869 RepID=A0A429ZR62_9ENTE|nr:hypothetical protein CBF37_11160 [Vagococcus vulneris]